jgi:hypothetical protein
MTVPKQDPEDYAMHEVATRAATKKLNPESLAMLADEAGPCSKCMAMSAGTIQTCTG